MHPGASTEDESTEDECTEDECTEERADAEPRWLAPTELAAWMSLTLMVAGLPGALGAQLQRDSDLSFVEYYVLAGLSEAPERTMRMGSLAVFANAELSRLSHLMRRLERRGFVERRPDPADGRCIRAVLTDEGYAHLVSAAPAHVARVRELVIDALTPEELAMLRTCTEKINRRVQAAS